MTIPEGDILIHAGDLTNVGDTRDVYDFNDFLGEQPHPYKIVIAGNHDFCFESDSQRCREILTNAIYLQDEAMLLHGITFYGSPWQPWFLNWAFNLERGPEIRQKWDRIPVETDVLITHGPPYGYLDYTRNKAYVGCRDLLEVVERIHPRLHVFGHIHEGAGTSRNDYTTFINASSCTADYHLLNPAILYDYEI
jgi:Icc-related predicted phosphoesterase